MNLGEHGFSLFSFGGGCGRYEATRLEVYEWTAGQAAEEPPET